MTVFNTLVYGIELIDAGYALSKFKEMFSLDDQDDGPLFDDDVDSFGFFCDDSMALLFDSVRGLTDYDQDEGDVVWELNCLNDADQAKLQTKLQKAAEKLLGKPCFAKLAIYSIASAC